MILPTGFGKTICFEALSSYIDLVAGQMRSCIIVVSPLIIVIVDQVRSKRQACVQAIVISCITREGSIVDKEFFATKENL